MGNVVLQLNGKPISIHKAFNSPNFNSRTVIVSDTWEYVSLWLKRHRKKEASFYWEQAKSFYKAAELLPNISSPLPSYYFMLNSVKALLISKNIQVKDRHGLTGKTLPGKLSLKNEVVKFKASGIFSDFCKYLEEPPNNEEYTLKDLLYNIPYVHRAFCLTYPASKELFVPIKNPKFVRKKSSKESWFCTELDGRYATDKILNSIPKQFEKDLGNADGFLVRYKKRFSWVYNSKLKQQNIRNLKIYHRKIRKHLYYIKSQQRLWYLKKYYPSSPIISRKSLVITIAIMHRLSEIARYLPEYMSKHLDSRHNWLLSEFIQRANSQFLDEITSEMTGEEAMIPGYISN